MKRHISLILLVLLCLTPVSVRYWIQETYGAECGENACSDDTVGQLARANLAVLGASSGAAASCAGSSCAGFLICQNFETTAEACDPCTEDNSESWDKVLGTAGTCSVDDTTATILRGSQQLALFSGDGFSSVRSPSFTSSSEVYTFFRYKTNDATPSTNTAIFYVLDSGNNGVGEIRLLTTGRVICYNGTAYGTNTTGTVLSNDTNYYIWYHYKAETSEGANDGVCNVWLNTSSTKPDTEEGSGVTAGTSVSEIVKVGAFARYGLTNYYDQILVKSTDIGSVCD